MLGREEHSSLFLYAPPMSRRAALTLVVLAALLAGAAVLRLLVGPEPGLAWPDRPGTWPLRIDQAITGATVGAALAVGGVLLQSLLKNPLASPDLIGAASGAGFAVTLSVLLAGSRG